MTQSPASQAAGTPPPRSFGVEEEYLLLDRSTGVPLDVAAAVSAQIPDASERVEREFFASQLETATPVCTDAVEAEAVLTRFRATAAQAAAAQGAVLAGTGLPPVGGEVVGTVTPHDRYRAIDAEMRGAGAYQYVTGTHVHVEIPSRDAGVAVLRRLARWAPMLLALTANSSIWCGEATGFASWRTIMSRMWPMTGYPPSFTDGADYARSVEQLVHSGVLIDPGVVTWVVRLSENFPTIELRIADAQLDPADAVGFAVIVRALVDRCLRDEADGLAVDVPAPGLVDGAMWLAARNGLEADLVDPVTAEALPAFEAVERMLGRIEAELVRFGDLPRVERFFDRLRREGSPARRQIARYADAGVPGLVDLYAAGSQQAPWQS